MGIVEDRSVEEERDLARMQIGAMMDTAGVGIATFEESSGWVRQRPVGTGSTSTMLQNISRDIVAPESVLEYERLQQALKRTERAEVRYRVIHPELGQRWLLTRVEPATLASGKRTASVVTLDITDQQVSQRAQRAAAARDDDDPREHDRRHRLPARRRAGALQPPLRGDAAAAAERRRRLEPGRAAVAPSRCRERRRRDPRGADRRPHLRDRVRLRRRRRRLVERRPRRRQRRAPPGCAGIRSRCGAPAARPASTRRSPCSPT